MVHSNQEELPMGELVRLVSKKTGLSEEITRTAVTTVLNFLKERLPAPIASQIDSVVNGGAAAWRAAWVGC